MTPSRNPSFAEKQLLLGYTVSTRDTEPETEIYCPHAELRRHLSRPWLRAEVMRQVGLPLSSAPTGRKTRVFAEDYDLARHAIAVGATGGGKSKLIEHLLIEHLRRGGSAVVIDPKGEITEQTLLAAQHIGLSPQQITLIDPCLSSGTLGWNPFLCELPISQAVSDFVSVLRQINDGWGPRLGDLLTNTALIIASHRFSLYELARFISRDNYREGLFANLFTPPPLWRIMRHSSIFRRNTASGRVPTVRQRSVP